MSRILLGLSVVALTASVSSQANPSASQTTSRPGGVAGTATPGQPPAPPRDTPAQQPTTGTARISGRVVMAASNTPLRRAQVWLTPSENPPQFRRTVFTDAQGGYEFRDLPAGKFTVSASRPGYLSLEYGQRRPYERGTPVVLNAAQVVSSVNFALPRGSVIAGRITDEFGEPRPSVQVIANRFLYNQDGSRRLVAASSGTTDDRGEFRLFGLMPSEYVITARVNPALETGAGSLGDAASDPRDGYPLTFYPGTTNVNEAQPITLAVGQEFGGLNFGLVSVRLARVSGTARDSAGRPVSGQAVLLPRDQTLPSGLAGAVAADGNFTIANVPPGEYNLDILLRNVSRTGESATSEFASMPVTVAGADVTGLRIATSRGAVVSGRVIWDGSAPRPGSAAPPRMFASYVSPLTSTLAAATDPAANGRIDSDGNFQIGGVSGRFLLAAEIPGWSIRSVRLDGREITNVPIDSAGRGTIDGLQVVMTDKSSMLAGTVTDARGDVVTQYVVVLQPADAMDPAVTGRFVRTARPDTNGRFEFRALPPGRYVATAIEALEPGRHYSPDFQRALRRVAREVSVREGDALSLDLKLSLGF